MHDSGFALSWKLIFWKGDIKYSDLNKDLLLTDYLLSLLVASSPAIIDIATDTNQNLQTK